MLRLPITIVFFAVAVLTLAGCAMTVASADGRPDCPGKIICPLTGELICKDRCPIQQNENDQRSVALGACGADQASSVDPNRPDCPGRIVCPLTGELVCKDRCPVNTPDEAKDDALPSCCQSSE